MHPLDGTTIKHTRCSKGIEQVPLFSVVIPTFNRRELLRQTLASVWAQSLTDYEVIVVDDGSTDGTWEELQALGSRVRALRQNNAGPGAARNLGAQCATGDYLAFLDSDDLWFPWTLATFRDLAADGGPAVVSGLRDQFKEASAFLHMQRAPLRPRAFADYLASWSNVYAVAAGMIIIRRDVFLKIGGFTNQPVNMEDHDLMIRIGVAKGFVMVESPVTLAYRLHAESVSFDLHKSYLGNLFIIQQEKKSMYPGGTGRAYERQHIICSHTRTMSRSCMRAGRYQEAWQLYRETFVWQVRCRRWRYLTAMPLLILATLWRHRTLVGSWG